MYIQTCIRGNSVIIVLNCLMPSISHFFDVFKIVWFKAKKFFYYSNLNIFLKKRVLAYLINIQGNFKVSVFKDGYFDLFCKGIDFLPQIQIF